MTNDYFKQRNITTNKQTAALLSQLPEFCEEYFISIEANTSPLTRLNYARDLLIFFDFAINNVRKLVGKKSEDLDLSDMGCITAPHIEKYLSYLSNYSYNGNVYNNNERAKARKLSSVRSLFRYLFDRDYIHADVAVKVHTPKIHQKEILRLDREEVEALLTNAGTDTPFVSSRQSKYNENSKARDLAILTLFLGTGIRVSELVGLNVNDIDFTTNSFVITRKGGSRTILYFSNEVRDSLRIWLDSDERKRYLTKSEVPSEVLFLSSQGRRISVRAVENLVKKYSRAVTPLKKITPHKLRSTYGTSLYTATHDIYVVAEVLGHRDINTTKKHYAAISEDIKRQASTAVKLVNNDEIDDATPPED